MLFEGKDRRNFRRFDIEYPLTVTSKKIESLSYKSVTLNISAQSIFCKIQDNDLNLFDEVVVKILVPVKTGEEYKVEELLLDGLVVRKEIRMSKNVTEYYIAVLFQDIQADKSRKLVQAVSEKNDSFLKKILNSATNLLTK